MAGFLPWQVVTYSFLHGGLLHLFFNMFALYMFGVGHRARVRTAALLAYYFVCVGHRRAARSSWSPAMIGGAPYPTVGASGGVFGAAARLRHVFPAAHRDADFSADPDAGVVVRHRLRR